MEYKAVLKDYKGSARKARLVVDLVRGKSVPMAQKILFLSKQKVAKQMYKLLNSAVANAKDLNDRRSSRPSLDNRLLSLFLHLLYFLKQVFFHERAFFY